MIHTPHSLRRHAYTLTELLVVMAIICVLSALAYTGFTKLAQTAAHYEGLAAAARDGRPEPRPPAVIPNPGQPNPDVDTGYYGVVPDQYMIAFNANIQNPVAEANRLAGTYQGRVISVYQRLGRFASLQIPAAQYDAFSRDPAIALVEPTFIGRAAQQGTPTGIRRMFSYPAIPSNNRVLPRPAAQSYNRNVFFGNNATPNRVHVAVIDTGIDVNHPDLNVVVNQPFNGYPPIDEHGHGTHVAGIIAARANNLGVVGVYPGAPLWALRITDASGSYAYTTLADALFYVFTHSDRIRVANMSIGGPTSVIINAMVDACVDNGTIMVSAAGNAKSNASTFSPASAAKTICVAAMADSDGRPGALGAATSAGNDDTFATFSNWGTTVAVIAPGVDITSTWPHNSYAVLSGTSMACPHVAGMCALLLDPTTSFGTNNRNLFINSPRSLANMTGPYLRSI